MAPHFSELLQDRQRLERRVRDLEAAVKRERARADYAERAMQQVREQQRVTWRSWVDTHHPRASNPTPRGSR